MRLALVTVLSVLILALQACSDIQVSQDYERGYNFAALKTFTWKPNDNAEYGVKDNDLLDKRIRKAIVEQLKSKSYVYTESLTADFFISYQLSVEQKLTESGVSTGVMLGRSSFGGFGGVGISSGSNVHSYDEGTLLIDFTAPLEDQLIWRGVSTQSVDKHSDPEESTANINETVAKILAQFPPEK
jgi:hypothetical protein